MPDPDATVRAVADAETDPVVLTPPISATVAATELPSVTLSRTPAFK